MKLDDVIEWMLVKLGKDHCLYQDDVVDYLVKKNQIDFLKENVDGNLVIGSKVLTAFKKATLENVVWVKSDRYWRYRVLEDEPGREARG
ncbi:hypothetical protein F951_02187 [Acinetobacter soli CIP 110264]|uniref:DUF6953 family protein n=1 Tax=Acinetobacter soli TaxID=487316 RepID=UPI0002CF8E15|nr:hypothetical protein [Acinetobacter soli]ENV56489.1 hypothetical protein F951_02187 [Acinetobacter soli CIP 110264]